MMAPQTITLPLGDARHSAVYRPYIICVFEEMSNGQGPIIIYKRLERCIGCIVDRPAEGWTTNFGFGAPKKDLAFGNQRAPVEGRKQSIFHPQGAP